MTAKRRHVVFINRFFFPDESATAQILADLAQHLVREGANVTVVTGRYTLAGTGNLRRRENIGGVDVRRVRSARWGGRSLIGKAVQFATFYPAALVELLMTVRAGDVLVSKTDPPLISVVAWLAAKLRRAHLINWLQDLYPEVASALQTPMLTPATANVLRRIRNFALQQAATNVVIGEVMASKLEAEGVPRGSINIVHNWADEQVLTPIECGQSSVRHEWGFRPGEFVVGYSGNLGRAHEFETILEAATHLSDRRDIKFLFVGGGYELERLKAKATECDLSNFVFKPPQPRRRLQETLGAADAHWLSLRPELEGLIVPSKFYGILAVGRPVLSVTASDGEIARVVKREECGYVVTPGDGAGLAKVITELADNHSLRADMGRRARQASERYFGKASALRAWTDIIRRQELARGYSNQSSEYEAAERFG